MLGAEEAVLDEHEEDFRHGLEVSSGHIEETRVEGSDDIVKEHFDFRRRVDCNILNELGQLDQRELSNVDLILSEAFKSLLDENGAMSFVFEKLHHVDDNLGLNNMEMFLKLLHGVHLEPADIKCLVG